MNLVTQKGELFLPSILGFEKGVNRWYLQL